MSTLLITAAAMLGLIVAYHTYGRWLARRVFQLDEAAPVPSRELQDGVDFVPSRKSLVFGHHFTSIAGTGPIVGPAIAVFWGWLPALLWVVFGSIFIGAVHDFGALMVSLRNRGQTIGEVAGRLISPRTKLLFLLILFFALTIVLAIFGLVIATVFKIYPQSVVPVWISLPLAIVVGLLARKSPKLLLPTSLLALLLIYASIYFSARYDFLQIAFPEGVNAVVVWTIILLVYCAVASVLPVWLLLQPRDYLNSQQLVVALVLLVVGLLVASLFSGEPANLVAAAPAVAQQLPADAPPMLPFLFITIACGAISGFHCLVSSGTSSKQIECESDAKAVGYGAMLLEGALAVLVIMSCCAGIGMGKTVDGQPLVGRAAWEATYRAGDSWSSFGLGQKVGAFVDGGANFLTSLNLAPELAVGVIAVLVACFAATTLDTATRLQRYVIQEIGSSLRIAPLQNMYVATGLAVVLGGAIAMMSGKNTPDGQPIWGTGGLILWPLFGATNQLLAGLALMVTVFYLWRRQKPVWFVVAPMLLMMVLPFWALTWHLFNPNSGWLSADQPRWLLASIAIICLALQIWMIVEGLMIWPKVKGVLEEALPPLKNSSSVSSATGGRSC